MFQRTLRRLKLPRERLHALRAFFVTTLLNGHVPAHVVRELAGHGDLATTQMYAAIVAGDRGSAVGVLERVYQGAHREPAEGAERHAGGATREARLVPACVEGDGTDPGASAAGEGAAEHGQRSGNGAERRRVESARIRLVS